MSRSLYILSGVLVISLKINERLKRLKSLRFQSFSVLALVGILPLIAFSLVLLGSYRNKEIENRIVELQARGSVISNMIVSSAFLSNDVTSEVDSELTQISDIYDGRILIADSGLVVLKDTYGLEEGKTLLNKDAIRVLRGGKNRIINEQQDSVSIIFAVYGADRSSIDGVLLMNFSLKNINRLYHKYQNITLTVTLLLSFFVLIISILYSGQIVRPMNKVAASIATITAGDFGETMDLRSYAEEERITDNFNNMLSGLQNLEDARQEFVSNVSHELKTPITSVKVLAESLIGQEGMPEELYQEFLVDINEELERMNKIINDLLSLVKMDKNAATVTITEVNINEFVEQILKQLQPIADKRNIEIVFESVRPVTAQIDEVKLGMAFRNLIENAIKYNYDNGWVRVSLNADHKFFYLKVSDSGVGIPEELQDNIFERFFRVDKARSRETGGNGLGLAITRNAILLHRGSIKVHSIEKQGTTFNVRIPLNYLE